MEQQISLLLTATAEQKELLRQQQLLQQQQQPDTQEHDQQQHDQQQQQQQQDQQQQQQEQLPDIKPVTIVLPEMEIVKIIQRVKPFNAEGPRDVASFIYDIDINLQYLTPATKAFTIQNVVRGLIQGRAQQPIRMLGPYATWTSMRETLIKNFGPQESYINIYTKAIFNQLNRKTIFIIITLLTMSQITSINADIQIENIEDEGIILIKDGDIPIISDYYRIYHRINLQEYLDTIYNLTLYIHQNADIISVIGNDQSLFHKISKIQTNINMLLSINEHSVKNNKTLVNNRVRRGLINPIGSIFKLLYGVMDNDDREEILEHLDIIDKNDKKISRCLQPTNFY
ncbi:sun domain-containing protein 1-like [Episyrphus balteatus]|uniref:sun domain-containing protein 1-like n=1 Tax=Episyrphus balteatus TaxID=286459 RepID=UPI002486B535|nr:sun domain-containing protein 1-like [Episyrphus balteatus]